MNEYHEINANLFPSGEWNSDSFNFKNITAKTFSDFNNYLGYFEIAKFMIDNNSLSKKEFETFFLYRLKNIYACQPVMDNINQNKKNWTKLISLMEQFGLKTD